MLELTNLTVAIDAAEGRKQLLSEVSLRFPSSHLCAVVGPSGCGKSTLLKAIAGLLEPDEGELHWRGRNLCDEEDLEPHEIGYVPQFSIAYEKLDVWESVETSIRLRTAGQSNAQIEARTQRILHEVGLDGISDRRVNVLSGGQKRRLALALEMVTSPSLLLADEVTSGLDPKSEEEIVQLLKSISTHEERIVLSVTHSLRHVMDYDSILVLFEGYVAYHGSPHHLLHYFDVATHEEIFSRLTKKRAESWHRSWQKHAHDFYDALGLAAGEFPPALPTIKNTDRPRQEKETIYGLPVSEIDYLGTGKEEEDESTRILDLEGPKESRCPGAVAQFLTLLHRRIRLFFREKGQLGLQVAMILGFPVLVAIFAMDGIPAIRSLEMGLDVSIIDQLTDARSYAEEATRSGGLVSGIVMFQVILLTLMGANNAAREIAGERLIFEKEKLGGVRAGSYVASKVAFLGMLVLVQSVWMGIFVKVICRFPGSLIDQLILLVLVNASVTALSLAISSMSRTPEQASLVSVYLVGFQLPLSGAVLALPDFLSELTKPFIAAYWSWSGILQTMQDTSFYEAVKLVANTDLAPIPLCIWAMLCHVLIGIVIAWLGAMRSQWD